MFKFRSATCPCCGAIAVSSDYEFEDETGFECQTCFSNVFYKDLED